MSQPNPQSIVPFIPETAPFTEEQRAWLNGYLAGMYSGAPAGSPALADAQSQPAIPLTILWGSQTGNAESLARKTAKAAKARGFEVEVVDMETYPTEKLKDETNVLVITSTYGDGEPPDNAAGFHAYVTAEDAPNLAGVRFGVLGLGDTNYPDFNLCAKEFDQAFEKAGATRMAAGVWCDVEFDEAYEQWLEAVLPAIESEEATPGNEEVVPVTDSDQEPAATTGPKYTRDQPLYAKLISNQTLNGEGSAKDVRHVEIDLTDSGLVYEAGDALGIKPCNSAEQVDEILHLLQLPPEEEVPDSRGEPVSLREALTSHYDISSLNKIFLESYAPYAQSEPLDALLSGDKDSLKAFLDGRQIIDVVAEYPAQFAKAAEFTSLLKKLAPRLYSISSSPAAHDGQVHLTVGVVRYQTHGRDRKGVCSNFLADASPGDELPIFTQPNKHFKPPADPATPMIMVGPGTGIAPFRAFLHERQSTGATGKNWLFFGDQKSTCDFLYQEELDRLQKEGALHRLDVAFSRETDKKVYVQDRMREHGEEFFRWLEEGAYFYICGDASRMAKDVDKALREIISQHGHIDADAADAYVDSLKKNKRYLRDVY